MSKAVIENKCDACDGEGYVILWIEGYKEESSCLRCKGSGKIKR